MTENKKPLNKKISRRTGLAVAVNFSFSIFYMGKILNFNIRFASQLNLKKKKIITLEYPCQSTKGTVLIMKALLYGCILNVSSDS